MGAGASVVPPDEEVRTVVLDEAASRAPYADPVKQAEAAFYHWDKDHDGYISQSEFHEALSGLQIDLNSEAFQTVLAKFDLDKDGAVSLDEFMQFVKPGPSFTSNDLYKLYTSFCSFGSTVEKTEMDGAKFAKFTRDCKLLDNKNLTSTDVDLTFAKSKAKGMQKIDFGIFESTAIPLLAERKFPKLSGPAALKALLALVAKGAPQSTGTQAESSGVVDRMTDTSAYTGTHKNRFDEDGQGVGMMGDGQRRRRSSAGGTRRGSNGGRRGSISAEEMAARAAKMAEEAAGILEAEKDQLVELSNIDLQNIYIAFCSFGSSLEQDTMDNAKFTKFCRDCGLLDNRLTITDVDLVFAKCKEKGQRKIDFRTFGNQALSLLATTKYPDVDVTVGLARIRTAIAKTGTPDASHGTVPAENIPMGNHSGQRAADARTVGGFEGRGNESPRAAAAAGAPPDSARSEPEQTNAKVAAEDSPPPRRRASLVAAEAAAAIAAVSGQVPVPPQLQQLYTDFCTFGSSVVKDEMDNSKFAKLCRDCGLLCKTLNPTDVDILFTKMKDKGQRKITYQQFSQVGIPLLAQKKYPSMELMAAIERILQEIMNGGGPSSNGTVAENNVAVERMLDPENATGMYKHLGPADGFNANQRRGSTGADAASTSSNNAPAGGGTKPKARRNSGGGGRRGSRDVVPMTEAELEALRAAEALERSQPPPMTKPDLHDLFVQFCSFGSSVESDVMDNSKFAKFARDCGLLDKNLTSTDVDLVYAKVKVKGERKINFNQFYEAGLPMLAAKKFPDTPPGILASNKLLRVVANAGAPNSTGTVAENNPAVERMLDPENATGMYKVMNQDGQARRKSLGGN